MESGNQQRFRDPWRRAEAQSMLLSRMNEVCRLLAPCCICQPLGDLPCTWADPNPPRGTPKDTHVGYGLAWVEQQRGGRAHRRGWRAQQPECGTRSKPRSAAARCRSQRVDATRRAQATARREPQNQGGVVPGYSEQVRGLMALPLLGSSSQPCLWELIGGSSARSKIQLGDTTA